jgi:arylsulfatase A-like enzyme
LKDGGNNGMFSGQKGFVSEGGTRTPAFVYAPNYIKGGRVKNG